MILNVEKNMAFSQHQNSDRAKKSVKFLLHSTASTKLIIETLMEEVKSILIKKKEFENRDVCNLKAVFAVCVTSSFRLKE